MRLHARLSTIVLGAIGYVICTCNIVAGAITYTSDTNLSDFTTGVTFGNFTNRGALSGDLPGSLPTEATINAGNRVYGNDQSPPVLVDFPAPTANIRVFPNIDHFGANYDGYQYTIEGSNDGIVYTPLFNAITVAGAGEPFTLETYSGTGPTSVNNILIGTGGGEGITGYIADFSFANAYRYFSFGASIMAINSGNADQELSAVASFVPEPTTGLMLLMGVGVLSIAVRCSPGDWPVG
jgi:hypothetical protein